MAMTADDSPFRGQKRVRGWDRVCHGVFVRHRDGLGSREQTLRELRAWTLVLPHDSVFTHLTGAWLRGWDLPKLPEHLPVFAAVQGDARRPRRPGLVCSRLRRTTEAATYAGLRVDRAEEILLRAARDLGLIDLCILVESALHRGDVDTTAMETLLASKRPGTRLLRTAWRRASAKAESPGETLLRLFHQCLDIASTPQVEIHDDAGTLLGKVDLLVDGTYLVHEYDGADHRGKRQHRTDLRRERAWTNTPYRRSGFTLDDLLNHAPVVTHEMDRVLGRTHDPRRIARWQALVEQSLYAESGRRRLMNRWNREMGLAEWSRKA